MTQKAKFTPCIVTSREGMEATVADVVRLKLELAQKKAAMELEIAAVQKRYQPKTLELSNEIDKLEAGIHVFCLQHRKELFPDKKSIDLLLATVGFRVEPPSVEKKGKDTWDSIALRLASLDWGQAYVNLPAPTVDKKALLADRDQLTPEQLDQVGIRFEQDEVFRIVPKSEVAEATVKVA